jgi:hypothetical protein
MDAGSGMKEPESTKFYRIGIILPSFLEGQEPIGTFDITRESLSLRLKTEWQLLSDDDQATIFRMVREAISQASPFWLRARHVESSDTPKWLRDRYTEACKIGSFRALREAYDDIIRRTEDQLTPEAAQE